MTAERRWHHAASAWSLLYRSMETNATEGSWALQLAAQRLRQAGDPDLAEAVDDLADDFAADDGAVRAMMDRVAELAARLEKETLG